jgi:TonB family protein
MRSYAATKIGQSDYELVLSVFFSFFLHAAIVVLALILYSASTPKVYIPPFYEVKLVGQPAEIAPAPAAAPAPPVTKAEPARTEKKPQPKVKIAAPKPVIKQLKQSAMPELAPQKKKTARNEEAKPATEQVKPTPQETASVPSVPAALPATAGNKTEGVAVKPTSGDFKFPPYLAIIKDKIQRNWNPPPGAKGMMVTILFKVHRSGRVEDTKIDKTNANFYFEQAATRAILLSSPFPNMPEDYGKDSAVFSVDLVEKE